MVAALVANRLTAPRPLDDVAGWAGVFASHDWLGAPAALLNDDRLGRALDAISARLDEIAGAVALAAVANFGVDAARLHWDFTSVAFCGAYADQDDRGPRIGFGHSPDRRGHPRQPQVAHATTPAGIALYGRVADGSRHEGAETHTLLEQLRRLAAPRRLLLVADSALVSKDNLAAADAAGMRFVSRLPRSFDYEPAALDLPAQAWRPLSYTSARSRRLPKNRRPTFRGAEDGIEITGPYKTLRQFRVLYIYGSEKLMLPEPAAAACSSGPRPPWPASAEAYSRPRQNPEGVERRVAQAVAAGRVGQLLRTQVHTDADGTVSVKWWPDQAAIAAAQQRDGLYALITNMDPRRCSPTGSWPSTKTRPNPSEPTTSSKDPSPCAPCSSNPTAAPPPWSRSAPSPCY